MIFKVKNIDNDYRNLKNFEVFLFYGPNIGKSENLSKKLLKNIFKNESKYNSLVKLNDINADSSSIKELGFGSDLFGDKKIIICKFNNLSSVINIEDLKNIVSTRSSKVIIISGDLEKKNKIRKAFESSKFFVSIPCYEDNFYEKETIIKESLKKEGIYLSDQLVKMLIDSNDRDRNFLNQKLEKIINYYKFKQTINSKVLYEIINDSKTIDIENLVYNIFSGNLEDFDTLYNFLFKQGVNNITILNACARHAHKLYEAKFKSENCSIETAVEQMKPPIFFKHKKNFINHLKIWNFPLLERVISLLSEIEQNLKTANNNQHLLSKFSLLKILLKARKLARYPS